MSTPQTTSALAELFNQYGRNIVYNQFMTYAPLYDKKLIPRKNTNGELYAVTVRKGEQASAGFIADGGTRAPSSAIQFAKGVATYKILDMPVTFQLGQIRTAKGKAGIDVFKENLKAAGRTAARLYDRSIQDHTLALPAGNVAAGQTTLTVTDASGWREGATVQQLNAGLAVIDTFEVTNISTSYSGSTVVTFSPALTVGLTVATDFLVIQGSASSSNRPLNLSDVNNSATSMYGLSTTDFPTGLAVPGSDVSTWSNEDGLQLHKVIQTRSGGSDRCTHILCSPIGKARIINAVQPQMRFAEGNATRDPYSFRPEFDGMVIIEDTNTKDSRYDYLNTEYLEIAEFWPWGPDSDGIEGRGTSSFENALKVERDTYSAVMLASMGFELICTYRRAFGAFTGITS
jgi:hypothetical protein